MNLFKVILVFSASLFFVLSACGQRDAYETKNAPQENKKSGKASPVYELKATAELMLEVIKDMPSADEVESKWRKEISGQEYTTAANHLRVTLDDSPAQFGTNAMDFLFMAAGVTFKEDDPRFPDYQNLSAEIQLALAKQGALLDQVKKLKAAVKNLPSPNRCSFEGEYDAVVSLVKRTDREDKSYAVYTKLRHHSEVALTFETPFCPYDPARPGVVCVGPSPDGESTVGLVFTDKEKQGHLHVQIIGELDLASESCELPWNF